jgi:hypothetical protein
VFIESISIGQIPTFIFPNSINIRYPTEVVPESAKNLSKLEVLVKTALLEKNIQSEEVVYFPGQVRPITLWRQIKALATNAHENGNLLKKTATMIYPVALSFLALSGSVFCLGFGWGMLKLAFLQSNPAMGLLIIAEVALSALGYKYIMSKVISHIVTRFKGVINELQKFNGHSVDVKKKKFSMQNDLWNIQAQDGNVFDPITGTVIKGSVRSAKIISVLKTMFSCTIHLEGRQIPHPIKDSPLVACERDVFLSEISRFFLINKDELSRCWADKENGFDNYITFLGQERFRCDWATFSEQEKAVHYDNLRKEVLLSFRLLKFSELIPKESHEFLPSLCESTLSDVHKEAIQTLWRRLAQNHLNIENK